MIAIEVSINVLLFAGIILVAIFAGFSFRSNQIAKHKRKVVELEKEMLDNHSEILELQKENSKLSQQIKEIQIPVIAMKKSREDKSSDKQDTKAK